MGRKNQDESAKIPKTQPNEPAKNESKIRYSSSSDQTTRETVLDPRQDPANDEDMTKADEAMTDNPDPDEHDDDLTLGTIDLLSLYLLEATRLPLLSAAEEVDLAERIESGAKTAKYLEQAEGNLLPESRAELKRVRQEGWDAKEHFFLANTRLVIHYARRYRGRGLPLLDLIQEGNIGLMRAIDKFEYRRGHRFSTYATWWIRQALSRAVADQSQTIRLPNHQHDQYSNHLHKLTELMGQRNATLSIPEFAASIQTPVDKLLRGLRGALPPLNIQRTLEEQDEQLYWEAVFCVSEDDVFLPSDGEKILDMLDPLGLTTPRSANLYTKIREATVRSFGDGEDYGPEMHWDSPFQEEENATPMVDMTMVSTHPSPEEWLEETELKGALQAALEKLPERESGILRLRFGLNEERRTFTLEEIGQKIKVTRERVRQLEKQALERLRSSSLRSQLKVNGS